MSQGNGATHSTHAYGFSIHPPAAPKVAVSFQPGNLAAGTYKYGCTFVTGFGETHLQELATISVQKGASVALTLPQLTTYANGVNIYRACVGSAGRQSAGQLQLVQRITITDHQKTHSWVDMGAAKPAPVAPPAQNAASSRMEYHGDVTFNGNVTFKASAVTVQKAAAATPLTSDNIGLLKLSKLLVTGPRSTTSSSPGGMVTDGVCVYFVTQGVTGVPVPSMAGGGGGAAPATQNTTDGHLICADVSGDVPVLKWKRPIASYSGVAGDYAVSLSIDNGRLYFGSALDIPQTYAPYQGMVNRYFGSPAPTSGRPARVYCVSAGTGDIVWESVVGLSASNVSSPGNFENITCAPVPFTGKFTARDGSVVSVRALAVGTSSSQDSRPWLVCPNDNVFGPALGSLVGFQHTDFGRVVLLDALSGELISQSNLCGGPGATASAALFRAGESSIPIHYFVSAADVISGGMLNNPAGAPFNSRVMFLLSGSEHAPAMLQGGQFTDNTGALATVPTNAPAGANFDGVAIDVNATFLPALGLVAHNGAQFPVLGMIVDTIQHPRIVLSLAPSAALTPQQIYQCSWFGAPVVDIAVDQDGSRLYVVTGQNTKIPYFESKLFDDPSTNLVAGMRAVAAAQSTYKQLKTPANLAAIGAAYAMMDSASSSRLNIPLSDLGNQNLANSVVCFNLSGVKLWSKKLIAGSVSHSGFTLDAKRAAVGGKASIAGITNITDYYGPVGYSSTLGKLKIVKGGGANATATSTVTLVVPTPEGIATLSVAGDVPQVKIQRLGNPSALTPSVEIVADGKSACYLSPNSTHNGFVDAQGVNADAFPPLLDWYADSVCHPADTSVLTQVGLDAGSNDSNNLNNLDSNTVSVGALSAAPLSVFGDTVLVAGANGVLSCYDGNMSPIATWQLEGGGKCSPVQAGNALYVFPCNDSLMITYPESGFVGGQYLHKLGL